MRRLHAFIERRRDVAIEVSHVFVGCLLLLRLIDFNFLILLILMSLILLFGGVIWLRLRLWLRLLKLHVMSKLFIIISQPPIIGYIAHRTGLRQSLRARLWRGRFRLLHGLRSETAFSTS